MTRIPRPLELQNEPCCRRPERRACNKVSSWLKGSLPRRRFADAAGAQNRAAEVRRQNPIL